MARKTDAELKARRDARAARLAAPIALNPDLDDGAVLGDDALKQPSSGVTPQQRLADLQAQRLEAMQQLADYKKNHRIEFFKPHVQQARLLRAILDPQKRTIAAFGGNRCLAPDEPIFNPLTGESVPVSKIPGSHYVLAWDDRLQRLVTARAEAPFLKGRAPMVRVRLSNGQEFRVSKAHRVLCPSGQYVELSQLQPGCELFHPPSTEDIAPSVRDEGDRCSSRTVRDSQADCLPDRRSGDERLLHAQAGDPASLPSRADAPQCRPHPSAPASERSDATGHTRGCSRACPQFDRLSTQDDPPLSAVPSVESEAQGRCLDTLSASARPSSRSTQAPPRSSIAASQPPTLAAESQCVPKSIQTVYPCKPSVSITSILPDGDDDVWDFTVPVYHNYYHQSTVHHNSGKTTVVAAVTVALALGRLPWVPKPKPFVFPNPLSVALLDASVLVTFPLSVVENARKTWAEIHADPAQAYDRQGHPVADPRHPHVIPPFPGDWQPSATPAPVRMGRPPKDATPPEPNVVGRFSAPVGANTAASKQPGTFEHLKSQLQAPTDPGLLRFTPPVKIRVFGEKTDTLADVQLPKLLYYFPPSEIALTKKGQTGVIEYILLKNGSSTDLLTYQQDPASMEGWDGHAAVYDEPPPRPVYVANSRGLVDHQGISLFSMTPLKEPWISDSIANNPDPSYFTLTMSSFDNPHVEKSALESFFATLDPEEAITRRDGKFLHLQGLVFKEFDKQLHVVRPFKPDRNYTVYAAIDNHPRTEQAVLFVAVDRHSRVFAFKEIFEHGTPEQIARWVIGYHDDVHPIEMVLIDRSSQADTNRGLSTYEVIETALNKAGIPLDFGSKDLQGGIQIVRDYLLSQNRVPSVFITEDCTRLIWEMLRYRWMEWRGGADKSQRTPMNKPVDADDHLIENLRRLLQLPAVFVDPVHRAQLSSRARWEATDPIAGY